MKVKIALTSDPFASAKVERASNIIPSYLNKIMAHQKCNNASRLAMYIT